MLNQITHTLPALRWTEYERGWGQRPDGFTVHRDEATARQYVKDYWAKQPKAVPDEYSRPEDTTTMIPVSDALYEAVQRDGSVWGHYSSTNFIMALEWVPRA